MPRSPEAQSRRAEYAKRWNATHLDYHREWYREHRAQERERKRIYREQHRDQIRAARQRYYADHPRPGRSDEPLLPRKFEGHPFFETARFICGNEPYWDNSIWAWEEAMAEAVFALVEGRDPNAAAAAAYSANRSWQRATGPLYDNVDVREDTRTVVITKPWER